MAQIILGQKDSSLYEEQFPHNKGGIIATMQKTKLHGSYKNLFL
jgi:hypothetical protein